MQTIRCNAGLGIPATPFRLTRSPAASAGADWVAMASFPVAPVRRSRLSYPSDRSSLRHLYRRHCSSHLVMPVEPVTPRSASRVRRAGISVTPVARYPRSHPLHLGPRLRRYHLSCRSHDARRPGSAAPQNLLLPEWIADGDTTHGPVNHDTALIRILRELVASTSRAERHPVPSDSA